MKTMFKKVHRYRGPKLTRAEKEFIRNIIQNYRKIDKTIVFKTMVERAYCWNCMRSDDDDDLYYITLKYIDAAGENEVSSPVYKRGTCFKGIKDYCTYTLEELGIKEEE